MWEAGSSGGNALCHGCHDQRPGDHLPCDTLIYILQQRNLSSLLWSRYKTISLMSLKTISLSNVLYFSGLDRYHLVWTCMARCPGDHHWDPDLGWRRWSSVMMTTGHLSLNPSTMEGESDQIRANIYVKVSNNPVILMIWIIMCCGQYQDNDHEL